jgi:Phage Tail Collar Domain/Phage tail fibre repeat
MVAKLLSDPTYFPIEFRRWLKDYIENSEISISQSQIIGGGSGGGSTNPTQLPAGIILPWAGATYGKDCLPCNGADISRTTYSDLFTAIGTTWGSSGGSTFRVPDLRDRALYGVGGVVNLAQTDGRSVGNRGGPNHHHDLSLSTSSAGAHTHSFSAQQPEYEEYYGSYSPTFQRGRQAGANTSQAPNHSHSVSGSTTGGYDSDKPSFAGVQYVITTGIVAA